MLIIMEKHSKLKHTNIIKTYNNNFIQYTFHDVKTNGLNYPLMENRFINNNTKSFYIYMDNIDIPTY